MVGILFGIQCVNCNHRGTHSVTDLFRTIPFSFFKADLWIGIRESPCRQLNRSPTKNEHNTSFHCHLFQTISFIHLFNAITLCMSRPLIGYIFIGTGMFSLYPDIASMVMNFPERTCPVHFLSKYIYRPIQSDRSSSLVFFWICFELQIRFHRVFENYCRIFWITHG